MAARHARHAHGGDCGVCMEHAALPQGEACADPRLLGDGLVPLCCEQASVSRRDGQRPFVLPTNGHRPGHARDGAAPIPLARLDPLRDAMAAGDGGLSRPDVRRHGAHGVADGLARVAGFVLLPGKESNWPCGRAPWPDGCLGMPDARLGTGAARGRGRRSRLAHWCAGGGHPAHLT